MPATPHPPASIVIPTHSEQRWHSLVRTVSTAKAQTYRAEQIVVVVDHNTPFFHRIRRDLPGITVLENRYAQGVSGNRNTGALHVTTPIVAFLDDDIAADQNWLARLIAPFADPDVVGTGGWIEPAWESGRPRWMPDEFLWAVGGSYAGMPTVTSPIRNVWSASMVVRRDVFTAVGGFRVGFGKLGGVNRPEDTELCIRMSALKGGHWMYVPDAVISHEVPASRSTFSYFVRRCYAEGRGKVQMAGLHEGGETLGAERDYLWSLPKAMLRNLGTGRLRQAGGVFAGVVAAGWGGVVETVAARRAGRAELEPVR
jgi:GT2 family glycosyltransferase